MIFEFKFRLFRSAKYTAIRIQQKKKELTERVEAEATELISVLTYDFSKKLISKNHIYIYIYTYTHTYIHKTNQNFKKLSPLTADGRLVGSVGTVPLAIAHLVQLNAELVGGALPLSRGATKWRGGAVLLITRVPAVVVAVTQPARRDADLVGALEVIGSAGDRWAGVVFVRCILTVCVAVTLPHIGHAETIGLALELVVVAEARTSSGWRTEEQHIYFYFY